MATQLTKEMKDILGPEPAAPEPRSLTGEFEQLSPILGELGGMVSDQYMSDQQRLLDQQYGWWATHYHQMAEAQILENRRATRDVRWEATKWLADAGAYTRSSYMYNVNPTYGAAMGQTDRMLGELGQRSELSQTLDRQALDQLGTGGPTTPFTDILDQRALSELKLGGQLTPEEERYAQQSAREAYSARGQVGGNVSSFAEVLNRNMMSLQRQREREQVAGGREQQMLGRIQYGQQFAGSREAAELQQVQAERQYGLEAARIAYSTDPNWNVLNQQPSFPTSSEIMSLAQNVRTPDPTGIMSAGLSYGSDLFNTNLNMQAAQNISWQNNQAALLGAQMQSQAMIQAAQAQAGAASGGGSGVAGAALGAVGSVAGAAIAVF